MDYSAEQAMELEALQAIYDDELQVYTGSTPAGWADTVGETYKITITPLEEGEELQEGSSANTELSMELLFAHTQAYPDSPPCFKLRAVYGLSDADLAACSQCLAEQVQQNLGMAMVFTLITSAKEWLRERSTQSATLDPEAAAKKAAAEDEARRAALRAHGTTVTPEAFKAWKIKFDAELAAAKARAVEAGVEDDRARRLTGKQYFLQERGDATLEAGALSDDDEEDFDDDEDVEEAGATALASDQDDDDEEVDFDDDEEDEGLLDELEKLKKR